MAQKTKITPDSLKRIGFVNYYEDGVPGTPETSLRHPKLGIYYYFGEIRYGALQSASKVKYIEDLQIAIKGMGILEGKHDYSKKKPTTVFC